MGAALTKHGLTPRKFLDLHQRGWARGADRFKDRFEAWRGGDDGPARYPGSKRDGGFCGKCCDMIDAAEQHAEEELNGAGCEWDHIGTGIDNWRKPGGAFDVLYRLLVDQGWKCKYCKLFFAFSFEMSLERFNQNARPHTPYTIGNMCLIYVSLQNNNRQWSEYLVEEVGRRIALPRDVAAEDAILARLRTALTGQTTTLPQPVEVSWSGPNGPWIRPGPNASDTRACLQERTKENVLQGNFSRLYGNKAAGRAFPLKSFGFTLSDNVWLRLPYIANRTSIMAQHVRGFFGHFEASAAERDPPGHVDFEEVLEMLEFAEVQRARCFCSGILGDDTGEAAEEPFQFSGERANDNVHHYTHDNLVFICLLFQCGIACPWGKWTPEHVKVLWANYGTPTPVESFVGPDDLEDFVAKKQPAVGRDLLQMYVDGTGPFAPGGLPLRPADIPAPAPAAAVQGEGLGDDESDSETEDEAMEDPPAGGERTPRPTTRLRNEVTEPSPNDRPRVQARLQTAPPSGVPAAPSPVGGPPAPVVGPQPAAAAAAEEDPVAAAVAASHRAQAELDRVQRERDGVVARRDGLQAEYNALLERMNALPAEIHAAQEDVRAEDEALDRARGRRDAARRAANKARFPNLF
mmetsp:Transcript_11586/g.35705  ORF Transcript_11586/g.35705 Transcript_11586/m.35705 type:complete len:633 (-) Transcript_11586:602-2500(-)